MRQLPLLLRKALRDFLRMGLRTWLTFAILAAGVAVYAGGYLAHVSLGATRDYYYARLGLADLDLMWDSSSREELPAWMRRVADGAQRIPELGITQATLRFVVPSTIELSDRRPLTSLEIYLDPKQPATVNSVEVVEGRYLRPGHPDEILVEVSAAKILGFKVGDRVTLDPYRNPHEVTIVGLGRTAEFLLPTANPEVLLAAKGSLAVIFGSLERISGMLGETLYNSIVLRLNGQKVSPQQQRAILEASAPLVFRTVTARDAHFTDRFLAENLLSFAIFIPVVSGIFGVVVFLVLLLSLSRLIVQEQREIGALLAVGRSQREIIVAYLIAAAMYGSAAAMVGGLAAPFVGEYMARVYAASIGLPPVISAFTWQPIWMAFALALIGTLFSVALPAWQLTRLTPGTAMRALSQQTFRGLPRWFEALLRPLTGSLAARYALRNVLRRPGLTLSVITLIALSIALSIAFRTAGSAWDNYATYAFTNELWDGMVVYKVPLPVDDAKRIEATHGVAELERLVAGFAALCDSPGENASCVDYRVLGIQANARLRALRFVAGVPFQHDDEQGIILNKAFNHTRPYAVGEQLWLVREGHREPVRVVGLTSDMTLGIAYVPVNVARRLLDLKTESSGFVARFEGDPRQAKKALFEHEMVSDVSLKADLKVAAREYFEGVWAVIDASLAISLMLAVLFMLSGLAMAILERESEYATLRTFGFTGAQVGQTIFLEVLAEALLAIALSFPLGYLLGRYLEYETARAWLEVDFHFELRNVLMVGLPTLLVLPLAAIPALTQLLRKPPAASLRSHRIG